MLTKTINIFYISHQPIITGDLQQHLIPIIELFIAIIVIILCYKSGYIALGAMVPLPQMNCTCI